MGNFSRAIKRTLKCSVKHFKKHTNFVLLGLWGLMLVYAVLDRGGINLVPHLLQAGLVYLMVLTWTQAGEYKLRFRPLLYLLGGFVLLIVWSEVFSQTRGYGIFEILAFTNGALLFFVFSQRRFKVKQVEKVMQFILILVLVVLVAGYFHYLNEPFRRLAGTFRNYGINYSFFPNACANFLLMTLPLGVYFFGKAKKWRQEIVRAAFLVFWLAGLWLTFSRGAILMLSVGILGWLIYAIYKKAYRQRKKLGKFLKLALILLLSVAVMRQVNVWRAQDFEALDVQEKAALQADEGSGSVRERLDFWEGSLQLMRDNWLIGSGPGSFSYVYPQYQKEMLALSSHPHNWFLKIGVENGILALVMLVGFLIGGMHFVGQRWSGLTAAKRRLVGVFLASASLGLMHNLVDYNFNFVANLALWWGMLGLMMAFLGGSEVAKKKVCRKDKVILAMVVLLSLVVTLVALNETYFNYYFRKGRGMINEQNYSQAERYLAVARVSIFPRNLYSELVKTAGLAYESTKDEKYLDKWFEAALVGLKLNSKDAFLWNELGKFAMFEGRVEQAYEHFGEAVQLDRWNNLGFHLNWTRAAWLLKRPELMENLAGQKKLLEDYLVKLKANAHLTVLSDNPWLAVNLAEDLAEIVRLNGDAELVEGFEGLRAEIEEAYWIEREKFVELYGESHFK